MRERRSLISNFVVMFSRLYCADEDSTVDALYLYPVGEYNEKDCGVCISCHT